MKSLLAGQGSGTAAGLACILTKSGTARICGSYRSSSWPFRWETRAYAAANQVLNWLTGDAHRRRITVVAGRTRRCASQEGNALAVCCRLGLAADSRVHYLAQSLLAWQWHGGGWNCDRRPQANHASFDESLAPLWGLVEYSRVTQDAGVREGWGEGADLLLRHRLFRSDTTGRVIDPGWLELHYPLYWLFAPIECMACPPFLPDRP